jgi:hypothetical protein
MRSQQIVPLLASALLAAAVATLLLLSPMLAQVKEPWDILVVSDGVVNARLTFIVASAHALVLGVPIFLLLRSKRHVGAVTCAVGGFLIGVVPDGVLALLPMFRGSAWINGTPTVINGVPTLAGWIEYAYFVGSLGLFGLAGGLTFWAAMRVSGQLARGPNGTGAQSSKIRHGAWGVAFIVVAFTCAIFVLPSLLRVRDKSCHNLFRDGRTSIVPQITADINLPTEDWPKLRQIFVSFGERHSLSFRGNEQTSQGTPVWRDLNLCSEAGVNIYAVDRQWLAQIKSPPSVARGPRYRGVQFSVFELRPGSDWKPLARDLINEIDTTWPQKTRFSGPDGRTISIEQALNGRQ